MIEYLRQIGEAVGPWLYVIAGALAFGEALDLFAVQPLPLVDGGRAGRQVDDIALGCEGEAQPGVGHAGPLEVPQCAREPRGSRIEFGRSQNFS